MNTVQVNFPEPQVVVRLGTGRISAIEAKLSLAEARELHANLGDAIDRIEQHPRLRPVLQPGDRVRLTEEYGGLPAGRTGTVRSVGRANQAGKKLAHVAFDGVPLGRSVYTHRLELAR